MNRLKVLFNLVDITDEMDNYLVDNYSLTLTTADEINIGYYKPINSLFIEAVTANTNPSKLSLYYYNGTSFLTTEVKDETKGLARSGFLTWNRNLTNEKKTTVGGVEAYWYKLKVNADTSLMTLAGLNLVFSSDRELKEEYPNIMDMLPDGATSFIGFHVASRKDILSYFRSQGKLIDGNKDQNNQAPKMVDQFDLLNYEELKDASVFLTLSKIMGWLSDAVDDKWYQKAKKYEEKYLEKIALVNLSLDKNDDGKADKNELNQIQFVQVVRA